MLKYYNAVVSFLEVPDEITLCINITGCKNGCKNCHSPYLAEDIGIELTFEELLRLYNKNRGITCISFMGGDSGPSYINRMAEVLKEGELPINIAWYSGKQELSKDINLEYFDYVKLGPYIEEFGPLNSKTTNQKFYKVISCCKGRTLKDETYKFWRDNE